MSPELAYSRVGTERAEVVPHKGVVHAWGGQGTGFGGMETLEPQNPNNKRQKGSEKWSKLEGEERTKRVGAEAILTVLVEFRGCTQAACDPRSRALKYRMQK